MISIKQAKDAKLNTGIVFEYHQFVVFGASWTLKGGGFLFSCLGVGLALCISVTVLLILLPECLKPVGLFRGGHI